MCRSLRLWGFLFCFVFVSVLKENYLEVKCWVFWSTTCSLLFNFGLRVLGVSHLGWILHPQDLLAPWGRDRSRCAQAPWRLSTDLCCTGWSKQRWLRVPGGLPSCCSPSQKASLAGHIQLVLNEGWVKVEWTSVLAWGAGTVCISCSKVGLSSSCSIWGIQTSVLG